jgi:hypothetical protein
MNPPLEVSLVGVEGHSLWALDSCPSLRLSLDIGEDGSNTGQLANTGVDADRPAEAEWSKDGKITSRH